MPLARSPDFDRCSTADALARLLRMLRSSAGLSQADMAERLHASQATVARWEAGGSTVSVDMLDSISAAMGLPGVMVHALHAQLCVDLAATGCAVENEGWRHPRGMSRLRNYGRARPPEEEFEPGERRRTRRGLDEWLTYWFYSRFPGGIVGLGAPPLLSFKQEMSDEAAGPSSAFATITVALGVK